MICPPTIIDIGTDEDAGEWLAMLPHCLNITVSEYRACSTSRDPARRGEAQNASTGLSLNTQLHDEPNATEAQRNHAR